MSNSLRPHGLQHARPPGPSPAPGAYSNSCPSSWWYHPTIPSSGVPFSSRLQCFPASGSFPVSQFFASGNQSIGVSASACPSSEYSRLISFRMDWLDLLVVQGTLKSLLQHHSSKTPRPCPPANPGRTHLVGGKKPVSSSSNSRCFFACLFWLQAQSVGS